MKTQIKNSSRWILFLLLSVAIVGCGRGNQTISLDAPNAVQVPSAVAQPALDGSLEVVHENFIGIGQ